MSSGARPPLNGRDLGPCACGGALALAENADGEPTALVHSLPVCSEYDELDPVEFLRRMNAKLECEVERAAALALQSHVPGTILS